MERTLIKTLGGILALAGCMPMGARSGTPPVNRPALPPAARPAPANAPAASKTVAQPSSVVLKPAPAATQAPGPFFEADWRRLTGAGEPVGFEDPARQSTDPPYWLATGKWRIITVDAPGYAGPAYQPYEEKPQPWLSFRVVSRADVPSRFLVKATVQGVSSPYLQGPIGEISIIPYYLDPTHYLEVLVTPGHVALWLADGAEPDTDRGWTALHFMPVRTAVGELRDVTIDMDLAAHRLTVTAAEQTYTLTHDFLQHTRPHRLAVRSAGNTFNLLKYRVEATQ